MAWRPSGFYQPVSSWCLHYRGLIPHPGMTPAVQQGKHETNLHHFIIRSWLKAFLEDLNRALIYSLKNKLKKFFLHLTKTKLGAEAHLLIVTERPLVTGNLRNSGSDLPSRSSWCNGHDRLAKQGQGHSAVEAVEAVDRVRLILWRVLKLSGVVSEHLWCDRHHAGHWW